MSIDSATIRQQLASGTFYNEHHFTPKQVARVKHEEGRRYVLELQRLINQREKKLFDFFLLILSLIHIFKKECLLKK